MQDMSDSPGGKDWGLLILMAVVIIAVLSMVIFSFKWGRPGGKLNPTVDQNAPATTDSADNGNISIVPPPVVPPTLN